MAGLAIPSAPEVIITHRVLTADVTNVTAGGIHLVKQVPQIVVDFAVSHLSMRFRRFSLIYANYYFYNKSSRLLSHEA